MPSASRILAIFSKLFQAFFFVCKRECHGKLRFGAWSYTRPEPRMTLFEAINYNFFQVFKPGPTYLGKLWRKVCMMTPHLFIEVGGGWNAMIPYNLQHVLSCNINQPRSWKVYEHFRDLGCWKRYVGTLCPVKWADPSYKHLLKPRFSMWIWPLWHTKSNNRSIYSLLVPHPSRNETKETYSVAGWQRAATDKALPTRVTHL